MELTLENNVNGTSGNGSVYHAGEKGVFNNNGNSSTQISYLSKLPAVDIEFNDLTYSVAQSRKGNHVINN